MSQLYLEYKHGAERPCEQGFLLVGVIVMAALVLIALSVAAPIVAKDLKRERELEAKHRGEQYVRAIRLYYKKNNSYPTSVKLLEGGQPLERYLRQHYLDPMTGKDDWKLIALGQAKTTVKGFFGQPLSGLNGAAGGGLGTAGGMQSSGVPNTGGTTSSTGTTGNGTGTGSTGDQSGSGSAFGSGSSPGSGGFGSSSFGQNGSAGGSGSAFGSGSTGPFVGVGIPKDGPSIITMNEQTDYSTWEFIYDPRIEQLYAKSSIFGGGIASSSGGLGSASSLSSAPGTGSGTNPAGPGSNPNNGQGPANGTPPVATPTSPTQ